MEIVSEPLMKPVMMAILQITTGVIMIVVPWSWAMPVLRMEQVFQRVYLAVEMVLKPLMKPVMMEIQ